MFPGSVSALMRRAEAVAAERQQTTLRRVVVVVAALAVTLLLSSRLKGSGQDAARLRVPRGESAAVIGTASGDPAGAAGASSSADLADHGMGDDGCPPAPTGVVQW